MERMTVAWQKTNRSDSPQLEFLQSASLTVGLSDLSWRQSENWGRLIFRSKLTPWLKHNLGTLSRIWHWSGSAKITRYSSLHNSSSSPRWRHSPSRASELSLMWRSQLLTPHSCHRAIMKVSNSSKLVRHPSCKIKNKNQHSCHTWNCLIRKVLILRRVPGNKSS